MAMQPAVKRWDILPPIPSEIDLSLTGSDAFFSGIAARHPQMVPGSFYSIVHQLLYNRGYRRSEAALAFLEAEPPRDSDPFQLSGMQAAVDRVQAALDRQERMAVYGDYDVDGLTATALLVDCLTRLGGAAVHYIPNRFDEGYGLNNEALEALHAAGVGLVITVDCGIRSVEEAGHARFLGLDLIISDHHHPGEVVPPALAVINPRLEGDPYPDKNLTGVGIAYKIACALAALPGKGGFDPDEYLDLVALGTIADVAPLTGENRALVKRGLHTLTRTSRPGLASLQGVTGLRGRSMQSQDIGFVLGPRLNAAGRLDSAEKAYRLLVSQDIHETGELAQILDDQNRERQAITRETQAMVEGRLDDPGALLIVDADEQYNPGIVGLVASRLLSKYYRPVLLAHRGEATTTGSCRSIPEFHIAEALDRCSDLLIRHGGHAAAAGFTVENNRWHDLAARLNSIAAESLEGRDLSPTITVDMDLPLHGLQAGTLWALLDAMDQFQPTGVQNPEPVYVTRNLRVARSRAVGRDGDHLKLTVAAGRMHYDAIAFRLGGLHGSLGQAVDLAYALEANEYMGERSLQLNVKDIRPAEG